MKATVIKLLNRRVNSPSVNASKLSPLVPGSVIEIESTVKGDRIDGNDVWYRTPTGFFVWSGGVELLAAEKNTLQVVDTFTKPKTVETINLLKLLQFNSEKPKGDGNQITICILDTGIFPHKAIEGSLLPDKSKSFIDSDQDATDFNGHGTCVAGIIAGNSQEMIGIAPKSKIINYKVIDNSGHVDSTAIYSALKHIAENELDSIDIINMSLDINKKLFPFISEYLEKIQSNGIIIVAAAGDNNNLYNTASLKNVIKVGSVEVGKFNDAKKSAQSIYNSLFLNQQIYSCSINNSFDYIGSSSAYTAVMTGVIANFLSDPSNINSSKQERYSKILDFLRKISFPLDSQANPEPFKIFKP